MDIPKALSKIRPGAKWNLAVIENGYDSLIWMDDIQTKPSLAEIEAAYLVIQAEELAIKQAEQAKIDARVQAVVANLPSWSQVNAAVTAISSLADAKAFIRKLARVVYWLAKDSAD
jgi:adenylosuccinate synthase